MGAAFSSEPLEPAFKTRILCPSNNASLLSLLGSDHPLQLERAGIVGHRTFDLMTSPLHCYVS